jgi:hypothetical protein
MAIASLLGKRSFQMATEQSVRAQEQNSFCVHWSAVFAGFFIAMLTYFILISLGTAIGAAGLKSVIQGDTPLQGLGAGAGLWTVLSVLICLFAGSYASSRVSGLVATRIGYTQGGVITALFFSVMLSGMGLGLGTLGLGLGSVTGNLVNAAGDAASNPAVTRVVEDALSDLNVDRPQEITAGVASRLLGGDYDSAVTFLSNRLQISRLEAQAHLLNLRNQLIAAVNISARKSADALRFVGWSAFGIMLLGAISGLFGGAVGAQVNFRKPLDKMDRRALRAQQEAYT